MIPKDRSNDLEAISRVIQEADHFIYISLIDYLPLLSRDAHRLDTLPLLNRRPPAEGRPGFDTPDRAPCRPPCACVPARWLPAHTVFVSVPRYWSRIDGLIREALILRKVHVRLLISCWENTQPLTFNFVWSLRSLCMEQANCSLEAVSASHPPLGIHLSVARRSPAHCLSSLSVRAEVLQPQSAQRRQLPGNQLQQVYGDGPSHLSR